MGSVPKRNRKKTTTTDRNLQKPHLAVKVLDDEPDDQSDQVDSRSVSTTRSAEESVKKASRSKKNNRKDRSRRAEFASQRILELRAPKISKAEDEMAPAKKGGEKHGTKVSRHQPLNRKIGTRLGKRQQETVDDTLDNDEETANSDQNGYPDPIIQQKLKKILKNIDPMQLTRISGKESHNKIPTVHRQIKSALEQISQIISDTLPLLDTAFNPPTSVRRDRDENPPAPAHADRSTSVKKPEPKVTRLSETATPKLTSTDRKSSMKSKRHQSQAVPILEKKGKEGNGKTSTKGKSSSKKVKNPLQHTSPHRGDDEDDGNRRRSESNRHKSSKVGKGSAKRPNTKKNLNQEQQASKIEEDETETVQNNSKITKMTRSVSASERTISKTIKQESTVVTLKMPEALFTRKGRGHIDYAKVALAAPGKNTGNDTFSIGHDHKSDPKVGQAVERRLERKIKNLENPPAKQILRTGRKMDPNSGKSKVSQSTRQIVNPLITAQTLASVKATKFGQVGNPDMADPRISQLEALNQSVPAHLQEEEPQTSNQSSRSRQRNRKKKSNSKKKPKQEHVDPQAEPDESEQDPEVSPQREPEPPALLPLSRPAISPRMQASKSPVVLQKATPSRQNPQLTSAPKSRNQSPHLTQNTQLLVQAKASSSKQSQGITPTNRLSPSHHSHRDVTLGLRTPKQQSPSSRNIVQPSLKPQAPKSPDSRPLTKPSITSAERSPNKTPSRQAPKDTEVRHLNLDIRPLGSQSDAEDDAAFKTN